MDALVSVEGLDLEQAGEVQSEENDDCSGDDAEDVTIALGDLADLGGGRAQRDEYDAETKDERDGLSHDAG